jgi:dihydrolipoamide dehydrogenase
LPNSVVPEKLVIMGAGAVGTEMATAYAGFGSKVTLVSSTSEVLPKIDGDGGRIVRESLVKRGVDVRVSTTVVAATREADGSVKVELSTGETITASELLVAAGREAQTQGIGLEDFGIVGDGSPVPVDESLLVTGVPGEWLYAAGDVNGRAPLTHSSKYHGRVVANAILSKLEGSGEQSGGLWSKIEATADRVAQPAVVFTDPNVASVGLTRKAALKAGITFREIKAPVKTLGAMLHKEGYEDGWAQW